MTFCDLNLSASSIRTEHLERFDVLLMESLCRIVDNGLDMQRMQMVIDQERRLVCTFLCHFFLP